MIKKIVKILELLGDRLEVCVSVCIIIIFYNYLLSFWENVLFYNIASAIDDLHSSNQMYQRPTRP